MSIIYQVKISPAGEEKLFNISWIDRQNREEKSFTQPASEITADELERLWQNPQLQLEMGRKLYRFLDGGSRFLERALLEAGHQGDRLILLLCSCNETSDWPFELLFQNSFLSTQQLHLVRCVSDWGKAKELPHRGNTGNRCRGFFCLGFSGELPGAGGFGMGSSGQRSTGRHCRENDL